MKMIATWFHSARGLAIGTIVGALTLGKATPYLTRALEGATLRPVVLTRLRRRRRRRASWSPAATATGPSPSRPAPSLAPAGHRRPPPPHPPGHRWLPGSHVGAVRDVDGELPDAGGTLHGAGMEAVSPRFSPESGASPSLPSGQRAAYLPGWPRTGTAARTWRPPRMVVSGACALVMGWLVGASTLLVITVGLIWGFAVVADSAQFSALVTEVAPAHAVGTALTLQTSLGFLLTAGSIWLTIELAARVGWGPSFALLAVGPVIGIWAILRLRSLRARRVA